MKKWKKVDMCDVTTYVTPTVGIVLGSNITPLQKKDTSVTFWAERKKFIPTYDTSILIIVTKPGIIIDVVGSYFYDNKS